MRSWLAGGFLLLMAWAGAAAGAYDGAALHGVDARIWSGVAGTNWIAQGEGETIIYAFIDPNCPYSRELFRKVQSLADPAAAQIRWIPVGVVPRVTEDSRLKAAYALQGGKKALLSLMSGGQLPARPAAAELMKRADENAQFLEREIGPYVRAGVPKVVYIRDPGNEVRVFVGVPPDKELEKILR